VIQPTLSEFLEARISEDEESATEVHVLGCDSTRDEPFPCNCNMPERWSRECAAKRAIVGDHRVGSYPGEGEGCVTCNWNDDYGFGQNGPCVTLAALASVYRDHPDFDPVWGQD
jgi:hypothetical protein